MFFGCSPCCGGGCSGLCLSTNYHPVTGVPFNGTAPLPDELGNTYGSVVSSLANCSVLLHRERANLGSWTGISFASDVGAWVNGGGVVVFLLDTCLFTPNSAARNNLHSLLGQIGSSMQLKQGDIFSGRVGGDTFGPTISSAYGLVDGLDFTHGCAYGIVGGTALLETDAFIGGSLAAKGRTQGVIMAFESIGSGYVVLCSDDDINGTTSSPTNALPEMLCRLSDQDPSTLFSIV